MEERLACRWLWRYTIVRDSFRVERMPIWQIVVGTLCYS